MGNYKARVQALATERAFADASKAVTWSWGQCSSFLELCRRSEIKLWDGGVRSPRLQSVMMGDDAVAPRGGDRGG